MPKISVIVPVYKTEDKLNRCVDSILNQTFTEFELILVDDGSPDNCGKICDEYAAKDSRVVVIHKENGGVSSARNCGLKKASGEFIAFIDSDDYIENEYLHVLITHISSYDLAICGVYYCSQDLSSRAPQEDRGDFYLELNDRYGKEIAGLISDRRLNYVYAKIFRSDIINRYNLAFDERVSLGEDTIFVFDYLDKVRNMFVVGKSFYNYIAGSGENLTSKFYPDIFNRFLVISDKMENVLAKKVNSSYIEIAFIKRKLISSIWAVEKFFSIPDLSEMEREKLIDGVLNSATYKEIFKSYILIKPKLDFAPIKPQSGKHYICKQKAEKRRKRIKAKILSLCPQFIIKLYRKIKYAKSS